LAATVVGDLLDDRGERIAEIERMLGIAVPIVPDGEAGR
jgi:hypothetical protein